MSEAVGILVVVAMIAVLLVLRMPIGLILLLGGIVGFSLIRGPGITLDTVGSRCFDTVCTYELSAVPLFLLMGHLAYTAGVTQDIYSAARAWLGHIKGSLVLATTFAAAGFAACCGSTTSSTAVFGKVAIPEMLRAKVDRRLAAGCVATVGTLAGMIPPSVNIIMFGIVARQSVPKLLMAGFVPGIMTALSFAAMIYIRVTRNPKLAPLIARPSVGERLRSLKGIWAVMVLVLLVLGGIYTGMFTPTEAGAVGAMGALIMALARRTFTLHGAREAFLSTAKTTSVIFIVMVGALIFSSYLAMSGGSAAVANFVLGLPVPQLGLVAAYMLLLVALGCFVDPLSLIFLTVPIIVPPLIEMGVNPIWLGILVVKCLEIGMITPPMGLNAFMLKSIVPDFSMGEIFGGIWWFIQVELITLVLLLLFPQIVLLVPNLMWAP